MENSIIEVSWSCKIKLEPVVSTSRMATTADFRNGLYIEFKNELYQIVSFQHVKPGKGGAFVRTKLKNITTKRTLENTFNAGGKITPVRLERRVYQFLYQDSECYYFMEDNTFETLPIVKGKIGKVPFIKSGEKYNLLFREDTGVFLTCEFPANVMLTITHTEPGAKGNTATKATKPATIETGEEIQVPLFINIGDTVKIDTASGKYLSRK